MAEGGDFGYDDTDLDYQLEHDDDDDDQEANTTRPFQPGAASTPYHGGEQHEMGTIHHEQSALPSYDEETPLLSKERKVTNEGIERRLAPKAKRNTLKFSFSRIWGQMVERPKCF